MSQHDVGDIGTKKPENDRLLTPAEEWFFGSMIVIGSIAAIVAFVDFIVTTIKYGF